MKDSENKLSSGILYSFIAAAVIIGVLAVTAVRSAGKLSEMYLDSSESSQVMTSELITVKDCIGSAEKNLLEAFSAQDDASEIEFLNAAQADLDALENAVAEDRLDIWSGAGPINELIDATQLRSAVFGSVNGGSRNIARNVFFSEYQPKLKAAEEYAGGLLSEAQSGGGEISEKLSARASVYERVCVGIGLLGISAMTFIGLFLDKKLRESAKPDEGEISPAIDTNVADTEVSEADEQLAEAEETIKTAVNTINILADGDPDAAADGEYPYRYENVLSAVRKMKARLKFISGQISRGAEFVSAESERVSDNGDKLSEVADRQEKAAQLLSDITAQMAELSAEIDGLSKKIRSGSGNCVSAAEECGVELSTLRGTTDMLKQGTNGLEAISSTAADIAGRANRLAVSAAVNAAKGEVDKNIAAFADEARGLALCASKLSEDAGENVKLLDSGINESVGAIGSASENISLVIDRVREIYDGSGKLENACAGELEATYRAKECTGDISENARLCGDISEEYAASGRKLSEQSEALKKIF